MIAKFLLKFSSGVIFCKDVKIGLENKKKLFVEIKPVVIVKHTRIEQLGFTVHCQIVGNLFRCDKAKYYKNRLTSGKVIAEIKSVQFFEAQCIFGQSTVTELCEIEPLKVCSFISILESWHYVSRPTL